MTPTFCYTMYIMKNQEETNMKLSELVEEVNSEQNLLEKVQLLCDGLTAQIHAAYKHTANNYYGYTVGKKYIKVISYGNQTSVWGFININEFTKVRKMERVNGIVNKEITFKEGDVLMSAGWNTPALNMARGNLLTTAGYPVHQGNQHGPSYLI